MTNEQLSLYLKQIAKQVRQLAKDVEPFIVEGLRQNKLVWVGEGKPPLFPLAKGYEMQPVGEFVAVQMIIDFAETLEFDSELLVTDCS